MGIFALGGGDEHANRWQPDRSSLVLEFWDRSRELSIKNNDYRNFVNGLFLLLLKYDIKNKDFETSSLIANSKNISAYIAAKEEGVIAGLEEFGFLNKDLKLKFMKKDGSKIKNGDVIVKIHGDAKKILKRERINLNLLQRMSGIATLTNKLNKKLKNNIKIAATRKTLWGLLDKKAVSIGNGLTHRLNLNDGVIIKDNHIKILNYGIEKALKTTQNKSKYIEIEIENKKQAFEAAKSIKKIIQNGNKNLYAIMLDKIKPKEIKSIIKDLKRQDLYNYVLLEASGNINENNLPQYKDCGVDIISMGQITNSAKALNMSMEASQIRGNLRN